MVGKLNTAKSNLLGGNAMVGAPRSRARAVPPLLSPPPPLRPSPPAPARAPAGFGASAARETLLVLFVVVRVLSKVGRQCIVLNPNPHRHPFNLSFAPPLQPFPALASSFNATLDQCRCQSPSSPNPLAFLCYISFSVRELVPIRSRPRPRQGWEGFLAGRWGASP